MKLGSRLRGLAHGSWPGIESSRGKKSVDRLVDGREHLAEAENAQPLGFRRLAENLGDQRVGYQERSAKTENI